MADPASPKNSFIRVEARLVADRRVDHLRERAGTGGAHQRPRGNQVGEVQRRRAALLGRLHDRRGADREIGLPLVHRGQILLERCAELHTHALGFEPFAVRCRDHAVRGQALPT